jgi:hypothetical protein
VAEVLRAAICDDEVMQALGRARGINCTADNPVEVHILADVVLPIGHDCVSAWETDCPDMVQRMLLVGLAVDSPAHAAKLHPGMFETTSAAESSFRRAAINRQNPTRDIIGKRRLNRPQTALADAVTAGSAPCGSRGPTSTRWTGSSAPSVLSTAGNRNEGAGTWHTPASRLL